MQKTLLLVFIHGFKGNDDTFGTFPKHLSALVSHALPNIDVVPLVYPKFETAGDLRKTVSKFREWLQDRVIDIEVAHNTPSPTVDPSVHTLLIGHSMGGIVAAETYLLLASEQPLPATTSSMNPEAPNFPSNTTLASTTGSSHPTPVTLPDTSAVLMFPHVQGVLAFDTPFLGLAPSMFASQVEGAHGMASTAYNTYSEAAKIFGWGGNNSQGVAAAPSAAKALPAPPVDVDAAAAPKWQSWGKVAMFAGAAGAVAAGGAAALYSQREKISAGWNWASGHLLFIGDLARAEALKRRVDMLEKTTGERNAKCTNLYTNLGKGRKDGTVTGGGGRRTFVNLPAKAASGSASGNSQGMVWLETVNDKAPDEITAHCSMFTPKDNPGFYSLGERAKSCVVETVDQGWYQGSEKKKFKSSNDMDLEGSAALGDGEGWEKTDRGNIPAETLLDLGDEKVYADGDGDDEVRMTESYEGKRKRASMIGKDGAAEEYNEELEDSVIVEKARKTSNDGGGAIPMIDDNPWAR